MFDWLRDTIGGWISWAVHSVLDWLLAAVLFIVSAMYDAVHWMSAWAIDVLWEAVEVLTDILQVAYDWWLNDILPWLSEVMFRFLDEMGWVEEVEYFWNAIDQTVQITNDVNYILPVYECLGIFAVTFGVISTIRVVRWILGLIPTIGG